MIWFEKISKFLCFVIILVVKNHSIHSTIIETDSHCNFLSFFVKISLFFEKIFFSSAFYFYYFILNSNKHTKTQTKESTSRKALGNIWTFSTTSSIFQCRWFSIPTNFHFFHTRSTTTLIAKFTTKSKHECNRKIQ